MESQNKPKKITIIDQTLREGMQFRGLVFSREQRIRILEFQEALGVDICQAGYPAAHPKEAEIVRKITAYGREKGFRIRTAALGRAGKEDADTMLGTGVDDLHFHFHVKPSADQGEINRILENLKALVSHIRARKPEARISLALLDLGRTRPQFLRSCVAFLTRDLELEMVSLPDTSGIMAPNQVFDAIHGLASQTSASALSVHCHNDMGMASANAFMGVLAGASVLEASALGIGERNGIADLFTTARQIRDQGISMNLDLTNTDLFREYYGYVDGIVREQTGEALLQYNFPFFGAGVRTHVAGTHAGQDFGTVKEEEFYLNLLCSRGLVARYLARENLARDLSPGILDQITSTVKDRSIELGRRLKRNEVAAILKQHDPG
ncbi:hypothetical protein [Desulfospira joergensenii]|uniref:hypothetical protein n=1 Tax=Desulfospira joergensenii TaxID=53329 RepID=UPI0003B41DC7|nr:hypothetical protein [Desulfospira joergensenii]